MVKHYYGRLLICVVLCCIATGGASAVEVDSGGPVPPECIILDNPLRPLYWLDFGTIADSEITGFGKTAFIETDAGWAFAYFRLGTVDVDMSLRLYLLMILDSTELDLPNQVCSLALDVGWTFRHETGMSVQLRLAPGFYTDLESLTADALNMPLTLDLIYAFAPSLSAIFGVEMRPGFARPVVPHLGLEWQAADSLRIQVQSPESRMDWFISQWWSTYAGLLWHPMGFHLHDDSEADREKMHIDELRAYWGVTYQVTDDLHLRGELGYVFERTLEFGEAIPGIPEKTHLESSPMLRFGFGGPF